MSIIKRITASVSASLEQAVGAMENHDAIIESALRDGRDAAARLKLQVRQIREQRQRDETRQDTLEQEAGRWEARAAATAEADRQRAIECLRRRDQARRELAGLRAAVEQSREQERNTERELDALTRRLQAMEARRRELNGRQLGTKGRAAIDLTGLDAGEDVRRAFDRWELDISRAEMATGQTPAVAEPRDALQDAFERDEEAQRLNAELERLRPNRDRDA